MGIRQTYGNLFHRHLISNLPNLIIGFAAIFIIAINIHYSYWSEPKKVFRADVLSYYAYLPAAIIHHDLEFNFVGGKAVEYNDRFWLFNTPINKPAILTTMGLSFLYLPFFLLAHLFALVFGYGADGFSTPYAFAIIFSSLFYVVLGLIFIKKVLLRYYDKRTTSISLLLIVVATNLLYYTTFEAAFTHAYNFSLISIFIYLVIRWHEKSTIQNTVLIGALAGLITLIRPTNIIVLLLLVLWDVNSWKDTKVRIMFFLRSWQLVLIMITSFIIVWLPQFIYWKVIAGSFIYYSYGSEGGSFFFDNPQIINQLFSYRKGWLLYTPIMVFALLGIPLMRKRSKPFFLAITIYLVAMFYVLSSWWSWWFGGGFSIRSYVDFYGVLAIPLAAFIDWSLKSKLILKSAVFTTIVLLTCLNLFQTWQYKYGILHFQSMTKEVYWAVFLKTEQPDNFYRMIENPDTKKAMKGIYTTIPKPDYIEVTKDNCLEATIFNIKNDSRMMKLIDQKAKTKGISTEEMIQLDAKWICDKKVWEKE